VLRDEFAAEWAWVELPAVFVNLRYPDRLLLPNDFSRAVKCFSDAKDTATLLVDKLASKVDGLCYRPGEAAIIAKDGRRLVNTYRAPTLVEDPNGDPAPFLDYMAKLIPIESERIDTLRWLATLYARPEIHMSYGLLLISETQGTGKTTLCDIAAMLVGEHNTSSPSEDQIMGQFNSWLVHKRLITIAECYTGHSRKFYNKLKVATDDSHDARLMYLQQYRIELFSHIIACSNSKRAIYLDDADRRWDVPRITEETQGKEYWQGFRSWLSAGGINIIAAHLRKFLVDHPPVTREERAPMTSVKEEVIDESRSDGMRMAHELAKTIMERDKEKRDKGEEIKKVVLIVREVRSWIAKRRGLVNAVGMEDLNDHRLEKAATIRKALVGAGLVEPLPRADRRIKIDGMREVIVANFEIDPTTTELWDKLKEHHYDPNEDTTGELLPPT
jgi:hypothetical protein